MTVYVVNHNAIVVSTAITIIQIKAGASTPLRLIRAHVSQGLSETSTQEQIQILKKSAAATVTSFTPLVYGGPNTLAAAAVGGTAATGITATAEGSDSDIYVNEGFNILNGWTWVAGSEAEQIYVPAAGIIALKFPVAPASATWRAFVVFREE